MFHWDKANLKQLALWVLIQLFMCTPDAVGQPSPEVVDDFIMEYIRDNHVPGMACCIIKDGEMVWSGAYGYGNIGKNIPMEIDGIMNIASISKTFTAVAAMQLWEKGLISLDTDINDYLPVSIRNPNHPEIPITVFQILTHTSSITDSDIYGESYAIGDPAISLKEWIVNYLTPEGRFYNAEDNFNPLKPGAHNEYSNVAFGLLGYLIEEISEMAFNEFCRKNILSPLGMDRSGWFIHEIDTSNHITPYSYIWDVALLKDYPKQNLRSVSDNCALSLYSFPNYPDGLLRTSVRELSKFLIAIINKGTYNDARILKASTIDKMLSLQLENNHTQGLCWENKPSLSLWGHSGGDPGVATHMFFNPETGIGIITFQNNNQGDSFNVLRKLYAVANDL